MHAQETRRIVDKLAGFTLSPLLWKFISLGLSAGRVQTYGLSMIANVSLDFLLLLCMEKNVFLMKVLTSGGLNNLMHTTVSTLL